MLADAESYECLGIGGDTITECRAITPEMHGTQHDLIFAGATTVENESTMHVSIGAHNEADAHVQIVVMNIKQRVGSE